MRPRLMAFPFGLFVLMLAASVLWTPAARAMAPLDTCTISGTVFDRWGAPVSGARVRAEVWDARFLWWSTDSVGVISDADGRYRCEVGGWGRYRTFARSEALWAEGASAEFPGGEARPEWGRDRPDSLPGVPAAVSPSVRAAVLKTATEGVD